MISEAFVVNGAVKYPEEAVAALWELMYYLSENLRESGAGIPVRVYKGDSKSEDGGLYEIIREMDAKAQTVMPYWEFYLGGEKALNFMKMSEKLYRNEISAEEFVKSLSR